MSPTEKASTPPRKEKNMSRTATSGIMKAPKAPSKPLALLDHFNQGIVAHWGEAGMNKATMTDEALKDILVEHAQDKGIKAALTSLVATGRSTTGQPGYTIARGGRPAIRYEYSAASDKEARKTFENPRQKRSDGEELKPAERARLEEMFFRPARISENIDFDVDEFVKRHEGT